MNKENINKEKEHLKAKIELLNTELKNVNSKLREAEESKSHFLSNVTNEIINPFTSILLLSKSISKLADNNLAKAREMAELIYNETSLLDFQLKNIFAAASFEAGEAYVENQDFDLKELILEIIEKHEHQILKKEISTQIESNSEINNIYNDRSKIRLILSNIIVNAIQYSPDGGTIYINFSISDKIISIEICDEGPGIEAHNFESIFDRFTRVNKTINSVRPGNGLGLSVVRHCVELLEGKIKLDSSKNKGSSFIIELPILENSENFDNELFNDSELF